MINRSRLINRLGEEQTFADVDTPADRRAEVEVETLSDTVAEIKAKKLRDTLGDTVAEMQL